MNRRPLQNTFTTEGGMVFDKETSTEDSSFGINNKFTQKKLKPQVLFSNNNKSEGSIIHGASKLRTFVVSLVKIASNVLIPLFFVYNNVETIFFNIVKILHRIACRIMLWDTWILQKNGKNNRKLHSILILCLVPLIIFGGFLVLYTTITGLTSWISTSSFNLNQQEQTMMISPEFPNTSDLNPKKEIFEPELNPEKTPIYDEEFQKKINDFMNEMEILNNSLENVQEEIAKMNQKISVAAKKCCRKSFLEIETYVQKNLNDFLSFDYSTPTSKPLNKGGLEKWLKTIFVAETDLETKIDVLTRNLKSYFDSAISYNLKTVMNEVSVKIKKEIDEHLEINPDNQEIPSPSFINEDQIKKIVLDSLSIYDADKTGLVDYAMESAGGSIISIRCTQTYNPKTTVLSIFGVPIWYPSNTPRIVITPGINPGQCWAFKSFPGILVIKLFGFVKISRFSMEHVSVKLSPNGKITSAPKDFHVYGLTNEDDLNGILLGKYQYLNDGTSLQFFPVDDVDDVVFNLVMLKVFSNHGNPNYTCLYRFRVHGELM